MNDEPLSGWPPLDPDAERELEEMVQAQWAVLELLRESGRFPADEFGIGMDIEPTIGVFVYRETGRGFVADRDRVWAVEAPAWDALPGVVAAALAREEGAPGG